MLQPRFVHVRAALLLAGALAALQGCTTNNSSSPLAGPFMPIPAALPAPQVSRPAGLTYAQFSGPLRPALDVIKAGAFYHAGSFIVTATMNGPLSGGGPNYYVWGFDKGGATNAPFPGEPKVIFNGVLLVQINADGSSLSSIGGVPLDPSATAISGSTFTVTFPALLLSSTGNFPQQYLWNVWPRTGIGGPVSQISTFAPDNAMAAIGSF